MGEVAADVTGADRVPGAGRLLPDELHRSAAPRHRPPPRGRDLPPLPPPGGEGHRPAPGWRSGAKSCPLPCPPRMRCTGASKAASATSVLATFVALESLT